MYISMIIFSHFMVYITSSWFVFAVALGGRFSLLAHHELWFARLQLRDRPSFGRAFSDFVRAFSVGWCVNQECGKIFEIFLGPC